MSGEKNKKAHGIGENPRFLGALELLYKSGARYLIVGGVACNLHGIARGTKDIDVLIPKDLENTDKILRGLEEMGWGMTKEIFAEDVIKKPFTIIGDLPRVDLLLCAGQLKFDQAYPNRITRTIDGVQIPYVCLDDLIKSKITGRDRDELEIKELKKLKALLK